MAEGTRVYSIGQVAFTWGQVDLMTGMADGSEITVTDTVPDKWTQHDIGIAGASTVQVKHPSMSGGVEMDIDGTSDLYHTLMAIIEADRVAHNQVATGTIEDHSDGSSEVLQGMRIANRPARKKGFDRPTYTFRWIYSVSTFTPNVANKNLIGEGITAADPLGPEQTE